MCLARYFAQHDRVAEIALARSASHTGGLRLISVLQSRKFQQLRFYLYRGLLSAESYLLVPCNRNKRRDPPTTPNDLDMKQSLILEHLPRA